MFEATSFDIGLAESDTRFLSFLAVRNGKVESCLSFPTSTSCNNPPHTHPKSSAILPKSYRVIPSLVMFLGISEDDG